MENYLIYRLINHLTTANFNALMNCCRKKKEGDMAILIIAFTLVVSGLLPVRVEASDSLTVVHLEYIRKDISELKTEVKEVKTDISELKTDISELKTEVKEVKTDISELRTELKTDISELKDDMNKRFDDVDKRITANTDRLFYSNLMVMITAIGVVITSIGVIISIWLSVRPTKTPNAPKSVPQVNESLETQNAPSAPSIATKR